MQKHFTEIQNISLVKTKTEKQTRVCVCVCVCVCVRAHCVYRYIFVHVPEKVWKDTWLYQTATVITSGKWFWVRVC